MTQCFSNFKQLGTLVIAALGLWIADFKTRNPLPKVGTRPKGGSPEDKFALAFRNSKCVFHSVPFALSLLDSNPYLCVPFTKPYAFLNPQFEIRNPKLQKRQVLSL